MVTNKESFIKLRRGLMEHLESGKINGRELSVYVALHMWVDFKYGFCWKVSSPFLAQFLNEKEQIVKRCMKSLSDKGYIKRFNHRGQKTYYPVLINHYEILSGVYTRADKTLNSNSLSLRVTFNCTLNVLQMNFKCPLNDLQVSPIKEILNIKILKSKRIIEDANNVHRSFDHLSITKDEYKKLCDQYDSNLVDSKIDALENSRKNTNYKSIYKTVGLWCKKDTDKPQQKSVWD